MEIESEDILVKLTEHVNVWSQETMAVIIETVHLTGTWKTGKK